MESLNEIILKTNKSELRLSLKLGGKILSLKLLDHTIIEGTSNPDNFCDNGNFLMFPWNSRLQSNQISNKSLFKKEFTITPIFKDHNNIALHGLVANAERELIKQDENLIKLKIKNIDSIIKENQFMSLMPDVFETFVLTENSLTIITEFMKKEDQKMEEVFFANGYHPYIQFEKECIDDFIINTNMSHSLVLDSKLLPVLIDSEYQLENIENLNGNKIGNRKFDDCFYNKNQNEFNYFDLDIEKKNIKICVNDSFEKFKEKKIKNLIFESSKQQKYNYFTVYTPNRNIIAIEPQTSGPNSYFMKENGMVKMKKEEDYKFELFNIELIKKS